MVEKGDNFDQFDLVSVNLENYVQSVPFLKLYINY